MFRILLVLPLLLVLMLAACSDDDDDPTSTPEPTDTASAAAEPTSTPTEEDIEPTVTLEPTAVEASPTPSPTTEEVEEASGMQLAGTIGRPAVPRMPVDVASLPDGGLAIADVLAREILIVNEDGSIEGHVGVESGPDGMGNAPFPCAVASDDAGTIYASSCAGSDIVTIDAEGVIAITGPVDIGGEDGGRIVDLATDPENRVYAVISRQEIGITGPEMVYDLHVLDSNLEQIGVWNPPESVGLRAVSIDADGRVHLLALVADDEGRPVEDEPARVLTLDSTGDDPADWTAEHITTDVMAQVDGLLALPNGDFLLVDEGGPSRDDPDGTSLYRVSTAGEQVSDHEVETRSGATFDTAPGLALDDEGRVLLADPARGRIVRLSEDLSALEAEIQGDVDGSLSTPSSLIVDSEGNIVVADAHLPRVQVFSPDGELVDTFSYAELGVVEDPLPGGGPVPSIAEVDGRYFLTGWRNPPLRGHILGVGPDGYEISEVEERVVAPGSPYPFIFDPMSMTAGPDGLLHIAMRGSAYVRIYQTDAEFVAPWPEIEDRDDVGHQMLAVAANEDEVFALVTSDIEGETGMAIKPLSDPMAETVLARFSPADVEGAIQAGVFEFAIGPEGDFYMLDPREGEVIIVDPDGEEQSRWTIDQPESRSITDIAVDAEGRVYLADAANATVLVYAPEG